MSPLGVGLLPRKDTTNKKHEELALNGHPQHGIVSQRSLRNLTNAGVVIAAGDKVLSVVQANIATQSPELMQMKRDR